MDYEEQTAAVSPVQAKGGLRGDVGRLAAKGVAGSGGALPHMERLSASFGGHDLSGVRAHVGGSGGQAAQAMGAQAYATGENVAFTGAPDLHTTAHEAAHVIQQRQGAKPVGGVGSAGDAWERQADAVADRVVQGGTAADLLGQPTASRAQSGGPVQRREDRSAARQTGRMTSRVSAAAETGAGIMLGQRQLVPVDIPRSPNFYFSVAEDQGMTGELEKWIMSYNAAAVPWGGVAAALGRLEALRHAGIDYMSPQAYVQEFTSFGDISNASPAIMGLRQDVTNAASPRAALAQVRAAQDSLSAVVDALQVQRNRAETARLQAEKSGLQSQVASINQTIADITGVIKTVEGIAAKAAAAYATAGASLAVDLAEPTSLTVDTSTGGQRAAGRGTAAHAKAGEYGVSVSGAVQWVMEQAYARELSDLKTKIGAIDGSIGVLAAQSLQLDLSAAVSRTEAAQSTLEAARAAVQQAMAARRQAMRDIGASIDLERTAESGRGAEDMTDARAEASRPDGAARATALMTAAQAVQELSIYLSDANTQLLSMEDGVELQRRLVENRHTVPTVDRRTGEVYWQEDNEAGRALGDCFEIHAITRSDVAEKLGVIKPIAKAWATSVKKVVQEYR